MKRDVMICEMAPRDGLQVLNRSAKVPLEMRVRLVETLQRAALPYIEAGAFVSPKRIPAMEDSAELFGRLSPYTGELAALVPNRKYYGQMRDVGNVDTVALFVSASEAYSRKNTRMSVDEALAAALDVAASAVADGYRVRAHISGAFRDLTEENGPTPEQKTVEVCERLRAARGDMVLALADTDGRAGEEDVERVLAAIGERLGFDGIGVHLHDRAGRGMAKVQAAYDAGVRVFDSAVGGIGGNPSALADPVGNVATEELVALFEGGGVTTGVDMAALTDAGRIVWEMSKLVDEPRPPSRRLAENLRRSDSDRSG